MLVKHLFIHIYVKHTMVIAQIMYMFVYVIVFDIIFLEDHGTIVHNTNVYMYVYYCSIDYAL